MNEDKMDVLIETVSEMNLKLDQLVNAMMMIQANIGSSVDDILNEVSNINIVVQDINTSLMFKD